MPRKKRRVSSTGFYHVMVKGIDSRNIFLDDADKAVFLRILRNTVKKEDCGLHLYCLMSNHVHLLVHGTDRLGYFMKRLAETYSKYHNKKYKREGHLFQNRYRSEVVENEGHLRVLFTYIHNNPVKAGMSMKPQDYAWSSSRNYYYGMETNWLDIKIYNSIFCTREDMLTAMVNSVIYKPTWKSYNRWTDEELDKAVKIILERHLVCRNEKITEDLILKIRDETEAPYKQLSRVLGVSSYLIENICKRNQDESTCPL